MVSWQVLIETTNNDNHGLGFLNRKKVGLKFEKYRD